MRRFVLASALLALTACSSGGPREPWIQDATTGSVAIYWEAKEAAAPQRLFYGETNPPTQFLDGTQVSGNVYKAIVTGLTPSTSRWYYVVSNDTQSPIGRFSTAPSGAEPYRFGVAGDNRTDATGHARVVQTALTFAPDFMLNTGDIADNRDYTEFFSIEKDLVRNSVLFPSPGNHDGASLYQYGFDRPSWYSFRWGNSLFLSISTDVEHGSGSAQYQWVESQLAAAATDASIDWVFAYHHYPVWSSGQHGNTASVSALNALYKQYGVDVVFNGHDHDYERIERDGVIYVVSGGGGVSPRSMDTPVSGQVVAESVRHVVIVDVNGSSLDLAAYRTDGSLLDARHVQH